MPMEQETIRCGDSASLRMACLCFIGSRLKKNFDTFWRTEKSKALSPTWKELSFRVLWIFQP